MNKAVAEIAYLAVGPEAIKLNFHLPFKRARHWLKDTQ